MAGLLYARNLHTHQMAPLGCIADDLRPQAETAPPPPPNLGPNDQWVVIGPACVILAWRELRHLPPPDEPETAGRDKFYDHQVATRPLTEPFQDALHFFTAKRPLLP